MSNNNFSRCSNNDTTTFCRTYNNDYFYWEEEEYVMKLFIIEASNADPLKGAFPHFSSGIYRVIVSDESGREFSTPRRIGMPTPAWNDEIEIRFSSYPVNQKLKLMVVRENCYDNPGTSTGQVVIGRATIQVPILTKEPNKIRVAELVKLVGSEKKVEALIVFQTYLTVGIQQEY